MGCSGSKNSAEDDTEQSEDEYGHAVSDENELIALKLIADAERATFDELASENRDSALIDTSVSVADSDQNSDISEMSKGSSSDDNVQLDMGDIDDDSLSIPTTIAEQSEGNSTSKSSLPPLTHAASVKSTTELVKNMQKAEADAAREKLIAEEEAAAVETKAKEAEAARVKEQLEQEAARILAQAQAEEKAAAHKAQLEEEAAQRKAQLEEEAAARKAQAEEEEAARIKLRAEEAEAARAKAQAEEEEVARKKALAEEEAAKLEAQGKAEEAARLKAEADAETERLRVQAEEEEAVRLKAQAEEDEALRIKAEAEEVEAARVKAQHEEEEKARIQAQEEEEAARIQAQQEAEATRIKAEAEEDAVRIKTQAEEMQAAKIKLQMAEAQATLMKQQTVNAMGAALKAKAEEREHEARELALQSAPTVIVVDEDHADVSDKDTDWGTSTVVSNDDLGTASDVGSVDRPNQTAASSPVPSPTPSVAKMTFRASPKANTVDAKPKPLKLTKQERDAENDKANLRMRSEMDNTKRREKSVMNRKRAAIMTMGAAKGKGMNLSGSGVSLGGVDQPLATRQSVRARNRAKDPIIKSSPRKKSNTSLIDETLPQVTVLNLTAKAPSTTGSTPPLSASANPNASFKLQPNAHGRRGSKGSIRPSIRNKLMNRLKSRRTTKSSRSTKSTKGSSSIKVANGELRRKPGAVTVAEIDAGLPTGDEYEALDSRAVDAARWTDKVVNQLIDEIKQRGQPNAHGQTCITFGQLFDETANIFDALVGILKTAKKYNIVHCKKDQLWQGQDDDEVITLLKDAHTGIVINRRKRTQLKGVPTGTKTKGFGENSLANQNSKCHVCSKTVYPMEFVGASDKAFHKACFKCKVCKSILKPTDFCTVQDEFYCQPHYIELINAAGGIGNEHKEGFGEKSTAVTVN
eukprot:m.259620 g.259620  ORF g.259620 m.259620 type:complete len:923 (-) comp38391_c0_seq1:45-2813(-)